MSRSRTTLSEWKKAFKGLDKCPYIGGRPQTPDDGTWMLQGRHEDLERISRSLTVDNRSVVVLDGYSGVGKSSLLENGLLARLREDGFGVVVSTKWATPSQAGDWTTEVLEGYVAECIQLTHNDPDRPIRWPDKISDAEARDLVLSGGLLDALDELYQGAAVIILDQFEELLRQYPRIAERVVAWVLSVGYRSDTRVVVSLRTDSVHLLEPLLRGVRPFSMDRIRVDEITAEEAIKQVIETTKGDPPSAITAKAVAQLMKCWGETKPTPKLLELQATLYVLYFRAKFQSHGESRDGIVTIERRHVTDLQTEAARDSAGLDLFGWGLRESLRVKIAHAEAASRREEQREQRLDEYLVAGTREIVGKVVPFLSSGDFKIPRRDTELAVLALPAEWRILEPAIAEEWQRASLQSPDIPELIAEWLGALRVAGALTKEEACPTDVLTARLHEVALLAGLSIPPNGLGETADAESHPRNNVTAGPMMSLSASATLFEELRRVAFAIEWLESASIVKKQPDGTLLLIHDGAGPALTAWAKENQAEPTWAIRRLTGARGEYFDWRNRVFGHAPANEEDDSFEVIANLNWRDCRVSADFLNVVFVNCDFSGLRFESCTFAGTTFVNCLLDDANFEECTIMGPADLTEVKRDMARVRPVPSFTVESSRDEIGDFAPYVPRVERELSEPLFFSATSGLPAQVGLWPPDQHSYLAHFATSGHPEPSRAGSILPSTGGVAMVGGRLCFLTINRCKFEEGGSFAFHQVSGSGLDVVEPKRGRLTIHDGAVRGISISRDEDEASDSCSPAGVGEIDLTVNQSAVVNLYFSADLKGNATFEHSFVMMLSNASKRDDFQVYLNDCSYQCVVNVEAPDEKSKEDSSSTDKARYFEQRVPTPPVSRFETRDEKRRRELATMLQTMDYRFRPEASQHEGEPRDAG